MKWMLRSGIQETVAVLYLIQEKDTQITSEVKPDSLRSQNESAFEVQLGLEKLITYVAAHGISIGYRHT